MKKLKSLVFLLFCCLCSAEEYVPGQPGGPWSTEEIVTVKAKLWRMFSEGEARRMVMEGTPASPGPDWSIYQGVVGMFQSTAPKALRQGFHDCLKYPDGSGGCDGCLSRQNMWHQWEPNKHEGMFNRPDQVGGDNNAMQAVSDLLEGIYIDAAFPKRTPVLAQSLKQSGKSRADLWALAAMTAVEFGISTNNMKCQNISSEYNTGCTHRDGEEDCEIHLPRAFVFHTGRRDCTWDQPEPKDRPYWHDNKEVHPNPHGSGKITVEFFKKHFNLTGRETVAIMGAHSFGTMRTQNAMFRYGWTAHNMPLFNNRYYRNMVNQDSWFMPHQSCQKIGDAWGNKPKTKFKIKANRDSLGGGPIQYLRFQDACPDCQHPGNPNYGGSKCCDPENIPEGLHCNPECSKYRLISGNDETLLNCDMGLYLGFDVKDEWRTVGCEGLENFNWAHWKNRFMMPYHNHQITSLKNETLCITALEDPSNSVDSNPLPAVLSICPEKPDKLARWVYNESSQLISLMNFPEWNLCSLLNDVSEDMPVVLRHHDWAQCHWKYDQFRGVIQHQGHPHWCIGFNHREDNEGNIIKMKPCDSDNKITMFGNWFYNHDAIVDFECPLQELAEPVGTHPLHQVVEEFAQHQDQWVQEFMDVLEKVLKNGYVDGELKRGPDMTGIQCFFPGQQDNQDWICNTL